MRVDRLIADSIPNPAGHRDLPLERALPHLGSVRLVDVREPDEWVGPLGHIPGAELVPLGTVLAAASSWDKDAPHVLVCRSGARSGRAAAALAQSGFQHMYNLAGGMIAWNGAPLPRFTHGTPAAELAAELHLAHTAMNGGDPNLYASPAADTREALAAGIAAIHATEHLPAEAAEAWRRRLEHRLNQLG